MTILTTPWRPGLPRQDALIARQRPGGGPGGKFLLERNFSDEIAAKLSLLIKFYQGVASELGAYFSQNGLTAVVTPS